MCLIRNCIRLTRVFSNPSADAVLLIFFQQPRELLQSRRSGNITKYRRRRRHHNYHHRRRAKKQYIKFKFTITVFKKILLLLFLGTCAAPSSTIALHSL